MTKPQTAPEPAASLLQRRLGPALVLTLNRPDALNTLDPELVAALSQALAAAEADPVLSAIVIAAEGRAFCAGADLKAARARVASADGDAAALAFVASVSALMTRIERCRKPVVAAVQGIAVAGGLELVLACDLVIAAESARFGDGHANYGLLPGGGGSVRLPRKLGPTRAKWLMFTAELLPATVAEAWGLVNRVVPDAALWSETESLVARLGGRSPLGLARMKQLVDAGLELPADAALALEQQVFAEHAQSHDRHEGLAAFAERRRPVFTGR